MMRLTIAVLICFMGGVMASVTHAAQDESKPKAEPLKGETVVDKEFAFPSQVLAYRAVDEIIANLCQDMKLDGDTKLVVFSERELNAALAAKAALVQIRALRQRYDVLLGHVTPKVAAAAIPMAATTLLQSLADLAALFQTDVEIKGTTTTVDKAAVVAELAGVLGKGRVIYPPVYMPHRFFDEKPSSSPLLSELDTLLTLRNESAKRAAASPREPKDGDKPHVSPLEDLDKQVDTLMQTLTKPDEKTGVSAFTELLRGDALRGVLKDEKVRILVIDVDATGGANKTTKGILTLFVGNRLLHTGGAVITFMLLDGEGQIDFSGTYAAETDFVKIREEHPRMVRFHTRPGAHQGQNGSTAAMAP